MLSDAQVRQFQQDGFLNGGMMLEPEEVEVLSRELDDVIRRGPNGFAPGERRPVLFRDLGAKIDDHMAYTNTPGEAPVWQILNIWECAPAFERLIYHPKIVKAISQLSGFGDLQVWHDQVQYKPALAGGATGWHQDAPLWPTIEPMTPVSAWIPLDDADLDNGAMWMVPGSHLWGNQQPYLGQLKLANLPEFKEVGKGFTFPEGIPPRPIEARPCPVKRGEVHFHHSLTWHGSPTNKSPRPRRAVAIHYMTSEAKYVGRRGHPMEQFITLAPGSPMVDAGGHFPRVCINGQPVGTPTHRGPLVGPDFTVDGIGDS
jgi:phytanoyl-CoA hydroxylase